MLNWKEVGMCFGHGSVDGWCCLGMYFRCGNCSLRCVFLYFSNVELGSRVACIQIALIKKARIVYSQSQLCRSVVATQEGFYQLIVFSIEDPSGPTEVIAAYSTNRSKAPERQPPGSIWIFEYVTSAVQYIRTYGMLLYHVQNKCTGTRKSVSQKYGVWFG